MVFSEMYASLAAKNAELLSADSICFVKGKVDRKRETPCLVVTDILPIADAVPKLTTTIAIKLDPLRHGAASLKEIRPVLVKHKGNLPVFAQVAMSDGQKVTMKLPKDLNVRPTNALVDDIDAALGGGTIQLYGEGARRLKRIAQQQALFKEAEQPADPAPAAASDEQLAAELDQEVMQEAT